MTKKYVLLYWFDCLWVTGQDENGYTILEPDLFKAKVFNEKEKNDWEKQNCMLGYKFHQLPE